MKSLAAFLLSAAGATGEDGSDIALRTSPVITQRFVAFWVDGKRVLAGAT